MVVFAIITIVSITGPKLQLCPNPKNVALPSPSQSLLRSATIRIAVYSTRWLHSGSFVPITYTELDQRVCVKIIGYLYDFATN